jgi:alkylation response protein AidB-like acyl-CoA dehydrogenase
LGGAGASFLDHTIAYEALGQGCPSTALAFNMHASVVMPVLQSAEVSKEAKQRVADLVVRQRRLIGGNFSEPGTTSLIGDRPLKVRARPADGGCRITGRKMFASMLEAADYVMVMAYPNAATNPLAGMLLLVPPDAVGRRVNANWDVLGMRATRSDSLMLEDCRVPESAVVLQSDDIRPFRHDHLNWFWGSYTADRRSARLLFDRRLLQADRQVSARPGSSRMSVPDTYWPARGPAESPPELPFAQRTIR